jgi:hypothetical protein
MVARTLTAAQIAALRIPTSEEIQNVAAAIPQLELGTYREWDARPGKFLEVGPGIIRLFSTSSHLPDAARDRALESAHREMQARLRRERAVYRSPMALVTDSDLASLDPGGGSSRMRTSRGKITAWSSRSRSRMKQQLNRIDYTPLFEDGLEPAMVTLTMPGKDDDGRDTWTDFAPTPEAFKVIVNNFCRAYRDAWGTGIKGVWKLEFQTRGAPHLHIVMTPPAGIAKGSFPFEFKAWVSRAWARAVGSKGNVHIRHERAGTNVEYVGEQYRDPRRIAVYFAKHGFYAAKDYQNELPKPWRDAIENGERGARFWGVWGLKKASAVLQLDDAGNTTVETLIDPLGVSRIWPNITGHYQRNDDGTWVLVEERRTSATDASWARAYQRMADDAGTRSSDAVKVERYMRKIARARAMSNGPARTITRGDGSVRTYKQPELVRNKHGQLVLARDNPTIRRIRFEAPDDQGTFRTVRRYRIGYYQGGSGFLLVNDGRENGRDIQRILDRRGRWEIAA